MTASLNAWSLVACVAVNLYLLGAMLVFAAVQYPQLGAIDRPTFPPAYEAFESRIGRPVVLFELLSFVTTLGLYAARPGAVPSWVVHAAMALGVAYFAITFAWHLPAHRTLAAGDNSPAALRPLLASQWARTVAHALRCGLLAWAVAQAIG